MGTHTMARLLRRSQQAARTLGGITSDSCAKHATPCTGIDSVADRIPRRATSKHAPLLLLHLEAGQLADGVGQRLEAVAREREPLQAGQPPDALWQDF